MKVYSFEKLEDWQHARKLALRTYSVTKKFPAEEKFGLTTQMRIAAISIPSILAEGPSKEKSKDQSHFSTIAYSRAIELLNDLIISNFLSFLLYTIYKEGILWNAKFF
jgi:four helix bundle protein